MCGFGPLQSWCCLGAVAPSAAKWDAIPQLVDSLQDEDTSVRFYAIEALRRITGTDNGYHYKASPQLRAEAVERWRESLKSNGSQNYEN
ncbi:MAG: hypothetical protein ACYS9C_13400 [Planctomycetota bacterium]